jgi:hypothetical protein
MKKKYIASRAAIIVLLFLVLVSCKKDMGNYSYKDINDAKISGIESLYTTLRGEKLSISPQLAFTQDQSADTSKYTYQWLSLDPKSSPTVSRVIATTRNLNWTVDLASTDKTYTIYYTVKEKSTGVIWKKVFNLLVNTNISDGWVILNETDNNNARLDYLNYSAATNSFQYYQDILLAFSTLRLKGKPQMVQFYQRRDVFSGKSGRSVLVGTDQNTFVINTEDNTFSSYTDIINTMSNYFPPPYYAKSVRCQGGNLSYMYDNLGQLFFENPTSSIGYASAVNKLITGEAVNISPMYAEGYMQSNNYALLYDVTRKRFMEHKNFNTSVSVPVAPIATLSAPSLFDPGNIGMDLVYMASTPAVTAQIYALFRNNTGKLFLARMRCNSDSFVPLAFDEITTAAPMTGASQFAIDPQQGYLLYATGSKIYRYNVFDKSNAMVADYGSRKISLIKYQKMVYDPLKTRYAEYATKLIVCTYEEGNPSSSGKMDLYNVPNLNGDLSLYNSFSGMGKIIDVTYRE